MLRDGSIKDSRPGSITLNHPVRKPQLEARDPRGKIALLFSPRSSLPRRGTAGRGPFGISAFRFRMFHRALSIFTAKTLYCGILKAGPRVRILSRFAGLSPAPGYGMKIVSGRIVFTTWHSRVTHLERLATLTISPLRTPAFAARFGGISTSGAGYGPPSKGSNLHAICITRAIALDFRRGRPACGNRGS